MRGSDDRAIMRVRIGRDANAQRFDRRDQFGFQALGSVCTDWHDDGQRHATLARRTGTEGSRSEGFRMKALPTAIATPDIHNGIMPGKLNGVMPAPMPSG